MFPVSNTRRRHACTQLLQQSAARFWWTVTRATGSRAICSSRVSFPRACSATAASAAAAYIVIIVHVARSLLTSQHTSKNLTIVSPVPCSVPESSDCERIMMLQLQCTTCVSCTRLSIIARDDDDGRCSMCNARVSLFNPIVIICITRGWREMRKTTHCARQVK